MSFEKSKRAFAITCAVLMIAMIFQNVSAEANDSGIDVDVFTDYNGYQHKVWIEDVNGTHQVFYANSIGDNNTGIGQTGDQITDSTLDVMYPQVAIDPVSDICYILWIVEGVESEEFWYCGSNDLENWTGDRYGGPKPATTGDPVLDMAADNYTLYVTWKQGGALTIIPDLDGDFISDIDDVDPCVYNVVGDEGFSADVVAVNYELGVSVAIDYEGESTVEPTISLAVPPPVALGGASGIYVNISTTSNESFTAIIKISYNPETLPFGLREKYLCLYNWDGARWMVNADRSIEEDTGIDRINKYVWGITYHLSTFSIADALSFDGDFDGLLDGVEMNIDDAPYAPINLLADYSATKTLEFNEATNNQTVYLNIPDYEASLEYVVDAKLVLKGTAKPNMEELFADRVDYDVGYVSYDMDMADFDNDGDKDIVIAAWDYFAYFENNGNGTFAPRVEYPTADGQEICSADFDNDDDLDIVIRQSHEGRFVFFANKGDGTFSSGVVQDSAFSDNSWDIALLDFDGDGDMDIANTRYGYLDIFANNGQGTFTLADSYFLGAGVAGQPMEACDFDGDTDRDIVVVDRQTNSESYFYLENNGDGTFSQPVEYMVGTRLMDVCVADFDNDGDRDIGAITHTGVLLHFKRWQW